MDKIFISYRRDDSRTITGRIIDRLRTRLPYVQIFKDVDSIPAGVSFVDWTAQHLCGCDVFIPIIGQTWAKSLVDRADDPNDYVRIELEQALEENVMIVPVFVNGADCPKPSEVPEHLSSLCHLNGIPVRRDPDFDPDMEKLITTIKKHLWSQANLIQKLQLLVKKSDKKNLVIAGGSLLLVLIVGWLGAQALTGGGINCNDHRIATHVANFSEEGTKVLTNTITVQLEQDLPDSTYSFHSTGYLDRTIPDYHNYIRQTYFENHCDTTGLFVNGLLKEENKIFNFFCTNQGLKIKHPDYLDANEISMTTPKDIQFDTDQDVNFIASFVKTLLGQYTLTSQNALQESYQFQKDHDLTAASQKDFNGNSVLGPLYFFRAHHYAMEGNDKRANSFYDEAAKYGNEEIQQVAALNKKKVKTITDLMWNDPELRLLRAENVQSHERIESGFQKFLRELGKAFKTLLDKIGIG